MLPLHWRKDREHNFGDALSPWLYERMFGRSPVWAPETADIPYLSLTGSHLQVVNENAVIWGTGLLDSKHIPNPKARYVAVRGPRSRNAVINAGGVCPEVYVDPVQLLPMFVPRTIEAIPGRVGVCLAVSERQRSKRLLEWIEAVPGAHLIDVTCEIAEVLRQIWACECVVSSSLHGLVAAHSYGIPALWCRFSNMPLGDGMKFMDYLEGAGASTTGAGRLVKSSAELHQICALLRSARSLHDLLPTYEIRTIPDMKHLMEVAFGA